MFGSRAFIYQIVKWVFWAFERNFLPKNFKEIFPMIFSRSQTIISIWIQRSHSAFTRIISTRRTQGPTVRLRAHLKTSQRWRSKWGKHRREPHSSAGMLSILACWWHLRSIRLYLTRVIGTHPSRCCINDALCHRDCQILWNHLRLFDFTGHCCGAADAVGHSTFGVRAKQGVFTHLFLQDASFLLQVGALNTSSSRPIFRTVLVAQAGTRSSDRQ